MNEKTEDCIAIKIRVFVVFKKSVVDALLSATRVAGSSGEAPSDELSSGAALGER